MATERERCRHRRQNFTVVQLAHQREQNALRMRNTRLRNVLYSNSITPVARRCNVDCWELNSVSYYDVGASNLEFTFCGAYGYKGENKGTQNRPHFGERCCSKGCKRLQRFPDLPEVFMNLFTQDDPQAKYFRKNIRFFNSGMAMASVQVTDATVKKFGPVAFKVSGQMFRRVGPMLQQEGSVSPACMQTYFYDAEYQAQHRTTRDSSTSVPARELAVRTDIFRELHRILTEVCDNSYLRSFLSINQFIRERGLNPDELRIELHATDKPPANHHPGRYNVPTCPEVALLKDVNPPAGSHRTFVCSVRQPANRGRDQLHFFLDYHRSVTPMTYPLLFPYGTDGWTINVRSLDGTKKMSHLEWLRFHLMTRSGADNFLHRARKLFQQYIVDEFERHQKLEMSYFVNN